MYVKCFRFICGSETTIEVFKADDSEQMPEPRTPRVSTVFLFSTRMFKVFVERDEVEGDAIKRKKKKQGNTVAVTLYPARTVCLAM